MIERLKKAMLEAPFRRPSDDYRSWWTRFGVRTYRLLYYTVRELFEHETFVRSAALTYYTLISVVPILALVFGVLKALGLIDGLLDDLYGLFPQNPEIIDYIVSFAEKTLARTRGGLVAAAGLVVLFWAVIRVFSSIESTFNTIWEIDRTRGIVRQWALYIGIVVVVPVLWIGVETLGDYLYGILDERGGGLFGLLARAVSIAVVWLVFTLFYKLIPYTHVRTLSALTGAIASGTAFLLFQWGYIYLQRWMTSYNAIYGSFAALPLFLLWVQVSWQILLVGGELAYAHQHVDVFDAERRALLGACAEKRKTDRR